MTNDDEGAAAGEDASAEGGVGDDGRSVIVELGEGSEAVPIVLRSLRSHEEYKSCEALERQVWGAEFTECVPPSLLMVTQKVGGVTAGAFDSEGRLVGMVYGLTGPREGRLVHWSHMLAVSPDLRSEGLGRELKLFQRRLALDRGVGIMLWTYDPLVAGNAHLNLNRLGALPVAYLRDLYGSDTASELHSGLGTDRFLVEWDLETESAPLGPHPAEWRQASIVNLAPEGGLADPPYELPHEERVRVEIPYDIQQVKAADPEAGWRWRRATRHALEGYLEAGYVVRGLLLDRDDQRCFYLLELDGG